MESFLRKFAFRRVFTGPRYPARSGRCGSRWTLRSFEGGDWKRGSRKLGMPMSSLLGKRELSVRTWELEEFGIGHLKLANFNLESKRFLMGAAFL